MKIVDRIFRRLNEINDKGKLGFPLTKGTEAYEEVEKICDRMLRNAFEFGGVAAVRVLNETRIEPKLYENWKANCEDYD